jgi:hypothetical protein
VSLEGPQRNYFHFTHFKALCLTYGDLMVWIFLDGPSLI